MTHSKFWATVAAGVLVGASALVAAGSKMPLVNVKSSINKGESTAKVSFPVDMWRSLEKSDAQYLELRDVVVPTIDQSESDRSSFVLRRMPDVMDSDSYIEIVERDGSVRRMPAPAMTRWRGVVSGVPDSRVMLTEVEGRLWGIVDAYGKRTVITPQGPGSALAFDNSQATASLLEAAQPLECATPDQLVLNEPSDFSQVQAKINATPLLRTEIAMETDSDLWQRMNFDADSVTRYVAALMGAVSTIYEDDINVTFHVSYLKVYTEGDGRDPYQANGDASTLLSRFTSFWRTERGTIPRDVAHALTARVAGGVVGVAFRATLCRRQEAFGASSVNGSMQYPLAGYSDDVNTVAHELGHNFGSRHTHDCWWNPAIDTCVVQDGAPFPQSDACHSSPITSRPSIPGTIMSYCFNTNPDRTVGMFFGDKVSTVLRNGAVNGGCLNEFATPTLLMQFPLGNQVVGEGRPLEIRWTSAQIGTVRLLWQDGNGSWQEIANSVPATQRTYDWVVPTGTSGRIKVRVENSSDNTISDESLAFINVQITSLNITGPTAGEAVRANTQKAITWYSSFVERVNIELSTNGGTSWAPITTARQSSTVPSVLNSFQWSVPNQAIPDARIRVVASDNSSILAETGSFRIGFPGVTLARPSGGEIWRVGETQEIRWNADFITNVRIQYSNDGGATWRVIRPFISASTGVTNWQIPDAPSEQVFVRVAAFPEDPTIPVASNPVAFTIAPASVSVDENQQVASELTVSPSPASERAQVSFLSQGSGSATLKVFNLQGREVMARQISVANGRQTVEIDVAPLAPGSYTVRISGAGTDVSKSFIVAQR